MKILRNAQYSQIMIEISRRTAEEAVPHIIGP
jgi:hypothetical protein